MPSAATILASRNLMPEVRVGSDALTTSTALSQMGPGKQLLFRRGETFVLGATLTQKWPNSIIGNYGDPAAPLPKLIGGASTYVIRQTAGVDGQVIAGLHIEASDATKYSGIAPSGTNGGIIGCEFANCLKAINCEANPSGLLIDGCAGDARSCFCWIQGDGGTIQNCVARSTTDQVVRGRGLGWTARNNDLTSVNSRPCLVLQAGGPYVIVGNVCRGGELEIGPVTTNVPANDSPLDRTRGVLMSGNTVIDGDIRVQPACEDVVITGNTVTRAKQISTIPSSMIYVAGFDAARNRGSSNIIIDGNTLSSSISAVALEVSGPVAGLHWINNQASISMMVSWHAALSMPSLDSAQLGGNRYTIPANGKAAKIGHVYYSPFEWVAKYPSELFALS